MFRSLLFVVVCSLKLFVFDCCACWLLFFVVCQLLCVCCVCYVLFVRVCCRLSVLFALNADCRLMLDVVEHCVSFFVVCCCVLVEVVRV